MDIDAILSCRMGKNDANAPTVREYLKALLHALWEEGESFSGKRPFGNSGWEHEIYSALVSGKLVDGVLDEYGGVSVIDTEIANRAIVEAISSL